MHASQEDIVPGVSNRSGGLDRRWIGPAVLVAVAIAYAGLAQFTIWLHDPVPLSPVFWPGAGLTLAALLLLPTRRWGWVIAGVAVAELTGNLMWSFPLGASLAWTVANSLGPLTGAALLRRHGNPRGLLVPLPNLGSFLLFGVAVGPAISATIGVYGSVGFTTPTVETFWQGWPSYLLSDALGVLVVAPLLLAWRRDRHLGRHPAETLALTAAFVAVGLVALTQADTASGAALPYLILPLLTWAGLRFGIRGAAVAVFAMGQVATWTATTGFGPFAMTPAGAGGALLPMFLLGAAVSVFVLAAVVDGLADSAEVEHQLTRQAFRDDLTGLPNRRYLTQWLSVRAAARSVERIVVLAANLDHFKFVNDGHGYLAGDEVLIQVARRLQQDVRPGDIVVRTNGDEFIIILIDIDADDIEPFARRLMASVCQPMTLSTGSIITQSISIGIADRIPGDAPEATLRGATVAMQHAKWLGRAQSYRFDRHLQDQDLDRRMVQTDLWQALAHGQITCHYQPAVDVAAGQVVCFEALARWHHPTHGLLAPGRFITAIEDMGAIHHLFETVLDQALATQADWATQLDVAPAVAVNLSANQLGDDSLPATVAAALFRSGTDPANLLLEVTETALSHQPYYGMLLGLHELGVQLAIDDFGTGWSSITRLAAFPWDLLKIDQSFVSNLTPDNDHARRIINSTITMAHDLGMLTTAEGVETPYQLEQLTQFGCDNVQGYLFTKPVPPPEALTHLTHDSLWTGPGSVALQAGTTPARQPR